MIILKRRTHICLEIITALCTPMYKNNSIIIGINSYVNNGQQTAGEQ